MRRRSRRLVVSLATLVAAGSGSAAAALAVWPHPQTEPTAESPLVGVLSPRRAPGVLRTLVADTRLASRVDLFATSLAEASCISIASDVRPFYARNADVSLIPASTLKLTTAAAFLAKLGGTKRFTTEVRGASKTPDEVLGDLVLIGGGDPLLGTTGYVASRKHPPKPLSNITTLAVKLYAAGVRHITGGIAVDDSRYDTERRVPSWSAGYTTAGDVGPIGALAVDDGFTSYAPLVAASDPGLATGQALRQALVGQGIAVDGSVTRRKSVDLPVLASLSSAPYAEVVGEMLRESDNNTAELLLKELARATGTKPGNRAAGAAARVEVLRGLGVPADAVTAIDGSGLDRSDHVTCTALLETLTTRPGGFDLESMLAIAGQTGTLNDRFLTSPLVGRMRAKTGTLDNVTALVGVTDPQAASKLRFAFMSNGPFTDAGGKALQDRLVATLATYPEAPAADTLAP